MLSERCVCINQWSRVLRPQQLTRSAMFATCMDSWITSRRDSPGRLSNCNEGILILNTFYRIFYSWRNIIWFQYVKLNIEFSPAPHHRLVQHEGCLHELRHVADVPPHAGHVVHVGHVASRTWLGRGLIFTRNHILLSSILVIVEMLVVEVVVVVEMVITVHLPLLSGVGARVPELVVQDCALLPRLLDWLVNDVRMFALEIRQTVSEHCEQSFCLRWQNDEWWQNISAARKESEDLLKNGFQWVRGSKSK